MYEILINPADKFHIDYNEWRVRRVKKIIQLLGLEWFKGKTVLDLACGQGNISTFFKSIYAFEPNPRTYELLRANVEKYHNITVFKQGLSDQDEDGVLKENPTNIGGTYISLDNERDESNSPKISLVTLDKFVITNEIKDIAFVKIDTEGFEARILSGAENMIMRHRPMIIFELSPTDFDIFGKSEVVSMLSQKKYRFVAILRNFDIGRNYFCRFLSLSLRIIFGESFTLRYIDVIKPGFYQMIVAAPSEIFDVTHK
jgi:FkbM family methyltransferase